LEFLLQEFGLEIRMVPLDCKIDAEGGEDATGDSQADVDESGHPSCLVSFRLRCEKSEQEEERTDEH
jgi:hypothetical protein